METPELCKICSKLTTKTPEQRQGCRSGVFIVNPEQISRIALVFKIIELEQLNAGWGWPAAYVLFILSCKTYSQE